MYLKTLTLRGFKSFASTTTLNFEPGITAIVGPNGAGKSNIVDALSWVMGEQGVKSLRGSKMEDVIFAGTAGRAPLGRAEVQLTIDNTDQALPIDYTEVTISRTMFRNGGSEYAINGTTCRLLDVQELLSDTGMGREMHVIVGQGQLDSILNANPEQRRGFIEEAAGVLKHRRRKERAQHKLEATKANLVRLSDLVTEIRRQLKPLGRQAEVARRAAVVQADVRDARARLLADELSQVADTLAADAVAEATQERLRVEAEQALAQARDAEASAEAVAAEALPRLNAAQELWYALTGLRERVASTLSIAAERVTHAADTSAPASLSDPDALETEAKAIRVSEEALRGEIEAAGERLCGASAELSRTERVAGEAEAAYALALRTASDKREGLARLNGQVGALRSRIEAGLATDERLRTSLEAAQARTAQALADFQAMETRIASLDMGQIGLDSAFEQADTAWAGAVAAIEDQRRRETAASQLVASLEARVEALEMSLGADVSAALVNSALAGIAGPLAASLAIEPGWEAAVAAALGPLAESVVADDLAAAQAAVDWLKQSNTGRAALLVRDAAGVASSAPPDGASWVVDLVHATGGVGAAVGLGLRGVVAVDDVASAVRVVKDDPGLVAVTREGDVFSAWAARGGAVGQDSLLQVQVALDQTLTDLEQARHTAEQIRFAMAEAIAAESAAKADREQALGGLNESDAAIGALTEQLSAAKQKAASAKAEAGRLQEALDEAAVGRLEDQALMVVLEQRLAAADADSDEEPDPTKKDAAAEATTHAREQEMEARLALRTVEERATALAGRADALMAAAAEERARRVAAIERAERLRREAEAARAVIIAARWLATQVDAAIVGASEQKTQADVARLSAQSALSVTRTVTREQVARLEHVIEGAHRDEMDRIEQRMRLEQLTERALMDLGLEADTLITEYGPGVPVPVGMVDDDSDEVVTKPYDRAEQTTRLRRAEQDLAVLGKVNPLALEEFDAMSERHTFLAEQMEDVKRTHADLLGIIEEVDAQVQQVFSVAFQDVAQTFRDVFARLFPGGDGQLVLTDPSDLLVTGVDVEARPAGKNVKRLSLLSGGERALVAVAFMLSLFIARPSPFYILDEVEAALDDTNLSRLLAIYQELRQTSQLLIITHQKRTMEVADALYGVTMRDEGVSRVVSQRLVDK